MLTYFEVGLLILGGFVPFITLARRMFHFFTESFVGKWGGTDDTEKTKILRLRRAASLCTTTNNHIWRP